MNMDFEDEYLDILQNMEFMTIRVYRQHTDLTDFLVDKAFEGLVRFYQAEKRGKSAPPLKLGSLDEQIYENVKSVCEFHLGRPSTFSVDANLFLDAEAIIKKLKEGEDAPEVLEEAKVILELLKKNEGNAHVGEAPEVNRELLDEDVEIKVTVDTIIEALKKIRKSISLWTKQNGRQGYLDFANQFQP